jgi:mannose-6-phosphate isomerase
MFMPYPIRFKEIYKNAIWGGDRLRSLLGKDIPPGGRTGESWEMSDHGEDTGIVANGDLAGVETLRTLCEKYPQEVLGKALAAQHREKFPLLLKFIDANDILSVQVHPPDEYARLHEDGEMGKTEAWYVIAAEAGSRLIRGLKPGTTKDDFRQLLAEGKLEECLNSFEVAPGDVVHIKAGTVHAIGKGILLAEIQQNSDVTYRVYDWNRVGFDGNPRPLHVNKALDVIDFGPDLPGTGLYGSGESPPKLTCADEPGMRRMVECDKFVLDVLTLCNDSYEGTTGGERFEVLCVIDGKGSVAWAEGEEEIKAGVSLLIPAALERYRVATRDRIRLLRCYVPG